MEKAALRNFKDFLQQYNRISETCFLHCVNNVTERNLTLEEERCADLCAVKYVRLNHKLMTVYVQVQPQIVNKRIEEMNKVQTSEVAAVEPAVASPSKDTGVVVQS